MATAAGGPKMASKPGALSRFAEWARRMMAAEAAQYVEFLDSGVCCEPKHVKKALRLISWSDPRQKESIARLTEALCVDFFGRAGRGRRWKRARLACFSACPQLGARLGARSSRAPIRAQGSGPRRSLWPLAPRPWRRRPKRLSAPLSAPLAPPAQRLARRPGPGFKAGAA